MLSDLASLRYVYAYFAYIYRMQVAWDHLNPKLLDTPCDAMRCPDVHYINPLDLHLSACVLPHEFTTLVAI